MKRRSLLTALSGLPFLGWLVPVRAEDEAWLHVKGGDHLAFDGEEWRIEGPPDKGFWLRIQMGVDCTIRRREFFWAKDCVNVPVPIKEPEWTGKWVRPEPQKCDAA